MKKTTILFLGLFLALGGTLLQQCDNNIWSFTAPPESEAGLIQQGRDLMNQGEYEQAEAKFAEALAKDSSSTKARYYHAKAALHATGFNSIVVANILTTSQAEGELPFMNLPKDSANTLYQVNETIINDLTPISDGEVTGEFTPKDINADLAIALTARGILSFRDTNSDGAITNSDVSLDFGFAGLGGFGKAAGVSSDCGNPIVVRNLNLLTGSDINMMIDRVTAWLTRSRGLIATIFSGSEGLDVESLNNLINDILCSTDYYYVNTGIAGNPGFGDNDHDGTIDEERLNNIDDDGDGLFDEDSIE